MLIDIILDRQEGFSYDAKEMYDYLIGYDYPTYQRVSRAMDEGTELDVKKALCYYIVKDGYNWDICHYIHSVEWLD